LPLCSFLADKLWLPAFRRFTDEAALPFLALPSQEQAAHALWWSDVAPTFGAQLRRAVQVVGEAQAAREPWLLDEPQASLELQSA
jgi:hypothetical protein